MQALTSIVLLLLHHYSEHSITPLLQVFNAVVDHARIEAALLTPDSASAEALLEGTPGKQHVRHNAIQVMYPQQSSAGRKQLISKLFTKAGNVAEQVRRAQTFQI
jgi:hypothetical protein